jgi:hypothetical protein
VHPVFKQYGRKYKTGLRVFHVTPVTSGVLAPNSASLPSSDVTKPIIVDLTMARMTDPTRRSVSPCSCLAYHFTHSSHLSVKFLPKRLTQNAEKPYRKTIACYHDDRKDIYKN